MSVNESVIYLNPNMDIMREIQEEEEEEEEVVVVKEGGMILRKNKER